VAGWIAEIPEFWRAEKILKQTIAELAREGERPDSE
jgi:hypothetical protein